MSAVITDRPSRQGQGGGRPTKYKAEFCGRAYRLCLLGLTDKELAEVFEVDEVTIIAWKGKYPKFSQSIAKGKIQADAEVAEKTFHRAKGYSHKAVKIFQVDGKPLIVPYTEHYPPDFQSASLWLRNRQPKKWRDKQELEHSGALAVTDPALESRRRAVVEALVAIIEDRARQGLPPLMLDITPKQETK